MSIVNEQKVSFVTKQRYLNETQHNDLQKFAAAILAIRTAAPLQLLCKHSLRVGRAPPERVKYEVKTAARLRPYRLMTGLTQAGPGH